MNAVPVGDVPLRRYRRRILGWGAVVVIGIYAGGAVFASQQVQDDLELRVVAEFDDAGVGPVTAKFRGQDGTLLCADGPVEIGDELLRRGRDLWGVNALDVDASCTGTAGDTPTTTTTVAPVVTEPPITPPAAPTTTVAPDVDDITSVVANDTQFSTLAGLLRDAGLDTTFSAAGPFTLFAPTNGAFQALGPDAVAALGRDPALLATVLEHHAIGGELGAANLTDGEIEMLDGTTILIATDADGLTLSSDASVARITEADLVAANGVVHAIDAVLLPAGVTLAGPATGPVVSASLVDGELRLSGVVASTEQRDRIVAAAQSVIAGANIIDELVVDPDADPLTVDAEVDRFAALLVALPGDLIAAEIGITPVGLTLDGTYATEAGRDAVLAVVAGLDDAVDDGAGIDVELVARTDASDEQASSLEDNLNALMAATPILFEPTSAEISPESAAVLDRVAAMAERLGGISIEIQGHTDSDGTVQNNELLSEARATAVLTALVERGVPAPTLGAIGFGSAEPVLDSNGAEDKQASRRVEFRVVVQ